MLLRILIALFIFGFSSSANADVTRVIETAASSDSMTSINVPLVSTVYTKSISLVNHAFGDVGVMYQASSAGTISISIQAERSYKRPTTEGAADSSYVFWKDAFTTSDTTWRMATLDTVVMPYFRFRITGTGSNGGATNVQLKVQKQ